MTDRELWMAIRRALLLVVDAIELYCAISPRTSEIRKEKRTE